MKAIDVSALLRKNADMVDMLGPDQNIRALAIVIPPEGNPIELLLIHSEQDTSKFLEYLVSQLAHMQPQQQSMYGVR